MNQNISVKSMEAPEFINLEPDAINPGISKCEVKVCYLGKNRNGSYINKETAEKMASTLPGAPIVGAYKKDIEDFGDHGEVIHIEDGRIEFSCKTMPYGFVAPDAKCWFQKFTDTDAFGNEIVRDYLMTQGYLWTQQYEEAMSCIEEGKGQSMELNPETMDGHWAMDDKTGIEFFIINEAVITKLCILGDDVEPCFEGASVTAPEISKEFTFNEDFANTLFTMMNELKDALQNKGGSDMPEDNTEVVEEQVEETIEPVEEVEETTEVEEGEAGADEFACGKDKKTKHADDEEDEGEKEDPKEPEDSDDKKDDENSDDEKKKVNHSLEEAELVLGEANSRIAELESELEGLRAYKLARENEEKDELFKKYAMLDGEDIEHLVQAKEQYSLQDLEAQLALLYVQKNVDFSTIDGKPETEPIVEEDPITTFSLDSEVSGPVPALVELLRQTV